MNDDAPFLSAIAADPEADGPRLRYADWLDERGDEVRAEFIRVQCALARFKPAVPEYPALRQRERQLLDEHWRTWLKPICLALGEPLPVPPRQPQPPRLRDRLRWRRKKTLPRPDTRYRIDWSQNEPAWHNVCQKGENEPAYFYSAEFRRGFIDMVSLVAKPYRNFARIERLFEQTPLTELHLAAFDSSALTDLGRSGLLARLRRMALEGCGFASLYAIGNCESARSLRALRIVGSYAGDAAAAVAQSTCLRSLTNLVFDLPELTTSGVEALANSPVLETVRHLDLRCMGLGDSAAIALANSPHVWQLEALYLAPNLFSEQAETRLRERFGRRLTLGK